MNNLKAGQDVTEVRSLIDKRMSQLNQTKQTLNVRDSSSNLVLKSFTNDLLSFSESLISNVSSSSIETLANDLEAIHMQSLSEIPITELNNITANGYMHSRYKALLTAIAASDYYPEFIQGALHEGCADNAAESKALAEEITAVSNEAYEYGQELADYLAAAEASQELSFAASIAANKEQLSSNSRELYLSIIKLINNVNNTNAVSATQTNSLINQADILLASLGTKGATNPALLATADVANGSSVNTMAALDHRISSLLAFADNMQNFEAGVQSLDLSKVLATTFQNMLDNGQKVIMLTDAASEAAVTDSSSGLAIAVSDIISRVSYIKGLVGQLSSQAAESVFTPDSPLVEGLGALKAEAKDFSENFPSEAYTRLKSDVATLANQAEKAASSNNSNNSSNNSASAADIAVISERIKTNGAIVSRHLDSFSGSLGSFPGIENADALNALNAIKKTAPSPYESLKQGNMLSFTQSLDNPALLTKVGECQQAIHNAMQDPEITTVELGMLTSLLDYINGESNREIMDAFVSDSDLQRSLASQSIDTYISEVLEPQIKLLDTYIKMSSERKQKLK